MLSNLEMILRNMNEQLFYITSMPESRLADYYLAYHDGCVFLDFNNHANPLDYNDSQIFKTLFKTNLKDQNLLLKIIKKSIAHNRQEIWTDALEEYNLNIDKD